MPTSPLSLYLDEVQRIRQTGAGTGETSYYPAIEAVMNAVGGGLKPRVFCLHHPSGEGGIPDFGLFEQSRARRDNPPTWIGTVVPERGVIEVKGAAHSIRTLVNSEQVRDQYLPAYGLVLTTNLWQFRLIRSDRTIVESFDLATSQAEFWRVVNGARPALLAIRFENFLQRCLLTRAPLTKPADVAFFLASYARDALARLTERVDLPALRHLRHGMEEALGIRFDGRDGEALFRSTLVQTLFYGVFSAWVTHVRAGGARFDWRATQWSLTVPVARFLFQQIATPEALGPLHLVELMNAAGDALERVDRAAFFAAFDDSQAIQYFYEPFLEFFDPALRRELGVWYTPPEIVNYMVERVDRVLRSELGRPDGLADPDVWVLDPCCGTGSYVVAVLDRIRRTLEDRGLGDLVGEELKAAALRRVVGFEIMTAPFVVAHWQVGEALRRAEAPLAEHERAAIFLTNALTDWQEGEAGAELPGFEAFTAERDAARAVKRREPILVVIGNPPYNGYAGVSSREEGDLVEMYKTGLQDRWGVKKFNLDDLFVRFFRVAERRIAEMSGQGIVAYISNWSWLFLPSFTVMRERLLANFHSVWVEGMNGDSRETGKITPDGLPDPSVFSTLANREGIRVGTAVATLIRRETPQISGAEVRYRSFWGARKRIDLLASLDTPDFDSHYERLDPTLRNRYLLRSYGTVSSTYSDWPSIDVFAHVPPLPGLLEKRGGGLIGYERDELTARMRAYLNPVSSFQQAADSNPHLAKERARYDPKSARQRVIEAEGFRSDNVVRYCFFAFDMRWAYKTEVRPFWNEPRPQLLHVRPEAAGFFVVRPHQVADPEGFPALWSNCLIDDHALHKDAFAIPMVENLSGAPRPNLSSSAIAYLSGLGVTADAAGAALLWHHILATLYSPAFLAENASGLRQNWPRVPLPGDANLLRSSATLGASLAALLDPDTLITGVTHGQIRPELRTIAVTTTRPGETRSFRLAAGWGIRTDKGVTSPGRGAVDFRAYEAAEASAASRTLLGARVCDIGMNAATQWRGVPEAVWECRIGGYQVLKKWLSYREETIIGRALTTGEVGHFQASARRIAAILLLGPELDLAHADCAAAHVPLTTA